MSENESDNEYTVEFTEDGFVSVAWGRNPAPPINDVEGCVSKEVNPRLLGRKAKNDFGKKPLSSPERDSNLALPILGSKVQHKTDTLDYCSTKTAPQIIHYYVNSSCPSEVKTQNGHQRVHLDVMQAIITMMQHCCVSHVSFITAFCYAAVLFLLAVLDHCVLD
uniref:Uncharacterized protein n=1 Tax=Timema tahoe TaxID=61484 RepID=A0A7R9NW98_9NEOP|nr:unnamed protein product [Timema tahoe]